MYYQVLRVFGAEMPLCIYTGNKQSSKHAILIPITVIRYMYMCNVTHYSPCLFVMPTCILQHIVIHKGTSLLFTQCTLNSYQTCWRILPHNKLHILKDACISTHTVHVLIFISYLVKPPCTVK